MTSQNAAYVLRANLGKLSDRDRAFASSLLANRRPTPKVTHWIGELAKRATAETAAPGAASAPAQPPHTSGLLPIVAMMQRAGARLKQPKVLFSSGDRQFRLSVAGAQSSRP